MNRENCSETKPSSTASAPAATKRELGTRIVFVADSSGKSIILINDNGDEVKLCPNSDSTPH